ncbi:hypothetical protein B0H10DRAFT_2434570 [Mycena sp. CBHHK59/15]|nr:hypothetical protein B0H10DRAFT_2434570 [Mycena sp. CBHHK59/15]
MRAYRPSEDTRASRGDGALDGRRAVRTDGLCIQNVDRGKRRANVAFFTLRPLQSFQDPSPARSVRSTRARILSNRADEKATMPLVSIPTAERSYVDDDACAAGDTYRNGTQETEVVSPPSRAEPTERIRTAATSPLPASIHPPRPVYVGVPDMSLSHPDAHAAFLPARGDDTGGGERGQPHGEGRVEGRRDNGEGDTYQRAMPTLSPRLLSSLQPPYRSTRPSRGSLAVLAGAGGDGSQGTDTGPASSCAVGVALHARESPKYVDRSCPSRVSLRPSFCPCCASQPAYAYRTVQGRGAPPQMHRHDSLPMHACGVGTESEDGVRDGRGRLAGEQMSHRPHGGREEEGKRRDGVGGDRVYDMLSIETKSASALAESEEGDARTGRDTNQLTARLGIIVRLTPLPSVIAPPTHYFPLSPSPQTPRVAIVRSQIPRIGAERPPHLVGWRSNGRRPLPHVLPFGPVGSTSPSSPAPHPDPNPWGSRPP